MQAELEKYFEELTDEHMTHLVTAASYESFPAGTMLAVQGEPGDRAFIILEGEVEVVLAKGGCEKVLTVRGSGSILGEMALLEDQPRAASLRTLTEVKAFVLSSKAFHGLLTNQPELSLAINRSLSARMRLTQETLLKDLGERIHTLEDELARAKQLLADNGLTLTSSEPAS